MAKILVVDDANLMRKMVITALMPLGHTIIGEAVNGNEAVQKYRELNPDLVTMDITMKEKDGLEAAEEILKEFPEARIIMVTALGQENLLTKAVRLGVRDFVVKPFTPDRLQKAAKKALQ